MRIGATFVVLLMAVLAESCGGGLFRQYEYDEDIYLSLDGSATIYVNTSIPALNALLGASFDSKPNGSIDRDAIRAYFTSDLARVDKAVTTSRRNNRRFVHVRLQVPDIRRLGEAPPFAWSSYRFEQDGETFTYQQAVTGMPRELGEGTNWKGDEAVAFRLHVPSKIVFHNAGEGNLKRGNILVWEQSFADRLRGAPIALEARMEPQSILYRTLWLFAAVVLAVALLFVIVIWAVVRRGGRRARQT